MAPTLAFIGAHPDDDVMGVSGIVALHRDDADFRFIIALATDGEGGQIAPGSDATRATLGAVRRREAVAGWDIIGRQPDRLVWLGLPDGGLADLPPDEIETRSPRSSSTNDPTSSSRSDPTGSAATPTTSRSDTPRIGCSHA